MTPSLKIGLFGAGHLGKIHLQQWQEIPRASLIGFYEPDDTTAARVAGQWHIPRFTNATELMKAADAVDIVSNTTAHYPLVKTALQLGRHVFVEKPLAATLEEARELVQLCAESGLKAAVGHVERFNPALLALQQEGQALQPLFVESHRLATYNPRGTDVSVILDLMIHDIDIVLHLVGSRLRRVSASGVAVVSQSPDIANARLEFENGCVANLTASRISLKKMRKMRLFQRDAYISLDFLEKKTEVVRLNEAGADQDELAMPIELGDGSQKTISVHLPEVPVVNAIREELQDFTDAVLGNRTPRVSLQDGYAAMDVAYQILEKMKAQQALAGN